MKIGDKFKTTDPNGDSVFVLITGNRGSIYYYSIFNSTGEKLNDLEMELAQIEDYINNPSTKSEKISRFPWDVGCVCDSLELFRFGCKCGREY